MGIRVEGEFGLNSLRGKGKNIKVSKGKHIREGEGKDI
jgi:hypothetical protein